MRIIIRRGMQASRLPSSSRALRQRLQKIDVETTSFRFLSDNIHGQRNQAGNLPWKHHTPEIRITLAYEGNSPVRITARVLGSCLLNSACETVWMEISPSDFTSA